VLKLKNLSVAFDVSAESKALTRKERSLGSLRSLGTTIPDRMVVFVSVDVKRLSEKEAAADRSGAIDKGSD
jgi:hypothetical protein